MDGFPYKLNGTCEIASLWISTENAFALTVCFFMCAFLPVRSRPRWGTLIFKQFHQSFWASSKHPLLSLEDHWCLYQTLKCTGSFSTNFHNVWNPTTSIVKLYWIFFLLITITTNIFFILWLSAELMFAPITFPSLMVICVPTHIYHDMCEKWKFSQFYRENVKKFFILHESQNSIVMLTLSVELT